MSAWQVSKHLCWRQAGWTGSSPAPGKEARSNSKGEQLRWEPGAQPHAVSHSQGPACMLPPLTQPQASKGNGEEVEGDGLRESFLDQETMG